MPMDAKRHNFLAILMSVCYFSAPTCYCCECNMCLVQKCATDTSLSLKSTVLKFAHKAVGALSYAISYSLQEFRRIAPVYHYCTGTITSKCN